MPAGAKPAVATKIQIIGSCKWLFTKGWDFKATTGVSLSSTTPDGSITVPDTVGNVAEWKYGALPGAPIGRTTFDGHVDSKVQGIGFFFYLQCLRAGDTVNVWTAAGQMIHYTVDPITTSCPPIKAGQIQTCFPNQFPKPVIGNPATNSPYAASIVHFMDVQSIKPGITMITCGGTFNHQTDDYPDNVVVTATPKSVEAA